MNTTERKAGALSVMDGAVKVANGEVWPIEFDRRAYMVITEAKNDMAKLIEAAWLASATLSHIYHTTTLPADLARHAHDDYQRLDAAIRTVEGSRSSQAAITEAKLSEERGIEDQEFAEHRAAKRLPVLGNKTALAAAISHAGGAQ